MTTEILIEPTVSERNLIAAARREIERNALCSQELSRAIFTIDHTRRLSTADYGFAVSVLRAELADAINHRENGYADSCQS